MSNNKSKAAQNVSPAAYANKKLDQLTADDKKVMAATFGMDTSQFEKWLSWAGKYAPLVYDMMLRLVDLLKTQPEPDDFAAGVGHHCPEELKAALCEAEQQALLSLALVMRSRHMACCDHEAVTEGQAKSE